MNIQKSFEQTVCYAITGIYEGHTTSSDFDAYRDDDDDSDFDDSDHEVEIDGAKITFTLSDNGSGDIGLDRVSVRIGEHTVTANAWELVSEDGYNDPFIFFDSEDDLRVIAKWLVSTGRMSIDAVRERVEMEQRVLAAMMA